MRPSNQVPSTGRTRGRPSAVDVATQNNLAAPSWASTVSHASIPAGPVATPYSRGIPGRSMVGWVVAGMEDLRSAVLAVAPLSPHQPAEASMSLERYERLVATNPGVERKGKTLPYT